MMVICLTHGGWHWREGGREGGNSGKLDAGGMGLVQQIA